MNWRKRPIFQRAEGANENFRDLFRRFRLNLRAFDASAEGASEHFRVFSTATAYDVIIFKSPLRAPMEMH